MVLIFRLYPIFLFLMTLFCSNSALVGVESEKLTPGDHKLNVTVNGQIRSYIVHVPTSYHSKNPVPVVIFFHGAGGTAENAMRETGLTVTADKHGFIVVFPEGTPYDTSLPPSFEKNPQKWNAGSGGVTTAKNERDDIAFVTKILDDLKKQVSLDERRLFATGFSNGASMAFRVGIELNNRIAAIAPVSGLLRIENPKLENPISLLYIIGTEDPLIPLEGGEVTLPWGVKEKRPPIADSLKTWLQAVECTAAPKILQDEEGVKIVHYGPCKRGAVVEVYIIQGMGHTWPGKVSRLPKSVVGNSTTKIDANEVIWDFFKQHPLE